MPVKLKAHGIPKSKPFVAREILFVDDERGLIAHCCDRGLVVSVLFKMGHAEAIDKIKAEDFPIRATQLFKLQRRAGSIKTPRGKMPLFAAEVLDKWVEPEQTELEDHYVQLAQLVQRTREQTIQQIGIDGFDRMPLSNTSIPLTVE